MSVLSLCHRFSTFLKILLYIVLGTQACVLVVLLVESILPCIDVVFNHMLYSVFKPYLTLIWSKLFNWIAVYVSVPTLIFLHIRRKVEENREKRPRSEVFRATQFYSLLDKCLNVDGVRKLCNTIITLSDALSLDQIEQLTSIMHKDQLLIQMLQMLDRKNGGKKILMEACGYLANDGEKSWWPQIYENVRQNNPHATLLTDDEDSTASHIEPTESTASKDVDVSYLYSETFTNGNHEEKVYELLNNFFVLSRGTIQVALVSSEQIELPFESELVSGLWQVTVSRGASVNLGLSHCMKLSAKNSRCRIAMVMGKIDTYENRKSLRLAYSEDASFSSRNEYGSLELPVTDSPTTYLVGVVKCPSGKPKSRGILSIFKSRRFVCQYSYLVFFQFRRQDKAVNYMHWTVHILSFKNICGLQERLMSCRFPDHYLLDPNASKCMDVTNGPLSVASVKAKGKKWEIFTPKTVEESMLNIGYHHSAFDIDWTGATEMPDDFHCTIKWNGTKEKSKIYLSPKQLDEGLSVFVDQTLFKHQQAESNMRPALMSRLSKAVKYVLFDPFWAYRR